MTVREWFRQERAAMWRDLDHPAHGVAAEIDKLGSAISDMTNLPSRVGNYCIAYWDADGQLQSTGLWVPTPLVVLQVEERSRDALAYLLYLAWPAADREKYDPTYAMLRGAASRWPEDLWK